MSRKYANPPLEEALCEFKLTSETRFDLTIPGLLYERLKGAFPHKDQVTIQEVELIQEQEGFQQQIRTSERMRFLTEDRKMLVQVGTRLLVINALKPYPHWEGFKPGIEMAWKSLLDAIEVQGLERIGLRYINRIDIPDQSVELSEYFEFYPFVGQGLPQQMVSFLTGVEFSYVDDRDHCSVRLTPISGSAGKRLFMLDIYYFLAQPRAVEVENALAWVEEAHSRVEDVFEGCITDKLREIFAEVS